MVKNCERIKRINVEFIAIIKLYFMQRSQFLFFNKNRNLSHVYTHITVTTLDANIQICNQYCCSK